MATIAHVPRRPASADDRFFLIASFVMAATIVAGFVMDLVMGRSTFRSPPLLHAHAIVFMGWVAIYVLQNIFIASGNHGLHRRLGWLATGWMAAMLVLGCLVTAGVVRRGGVPFFFRPQHFLIFDPLTLVAFVGLTSAAIVLRRHTYWHRRLHFCGMSLLVGPAFGRLLPMPLLQPWAYETVFAATLTFPIAGVIADVRRSGHVHPAWGWGIGAMFASLLVTNAVTYSPVGDAIYAAVTAGSPGAAVDPLAFAPPPWAVPAASRR